MKIKSKLNLNSQESCKQKYSNHKRPFLKITALYQKIQFDSNKENKKQKIKKQKNTH